MSQELSSILQGVYPLSTTMLCFLTFEKLIGNRSENGERGSWAHT